jgi:hypothetical protein
MGEPAVRLHSYEEYLRIEQESGLKHEFFEGHVVAMAGGSVVHALLGARVLTRLANGLQGRNCVAVGSDLKIASPSGLSCSGLSEARGARHGRPPRRPPSRRSSPGSRRGALDGGPMTPSPPRCGTGCQVGIRHRKPRR